MIIISAGVERSSYWQRERYAVERAGRYEQFLRYVDGQAGDTDLRRLKFLVLTCATQPISWLAVQRSGLKALAFVRQFKKRSLQPARWAKRFLALAER